MICWTYPANDPVVLVKAENISTYGYDPYTNMAGAQGDALPESRLA